VNWTFIDGANAIQTCDSSGTVAMQILVNGVPVVDVFGNTTFTCADFPDSITFDVPIGSSDIEFDAFDVNNQFIVQQHQPVNINTCGNTTTSMSLAMIQAPLVIDYVVNSCLSSDVLWYSLTDLTTNVTTIVDSARAPHLVVTCGLQAAFSPAFFGPYRLNAIELVDNTDPSAPILVAANCAPQPEVNHLGFDSIPVTLGSPAGGRCF
jgi:hypothetical protein